MAILSKIRDRSMFLILIVGLALFAFVLDPSSIQQFFSSSKINVVGEVNGQEIDREAFAQRVESYKSQNGGRVTQMQSVNAVWDAMLSEKIFETQLEKAGIVVGEKDIWDAMVNLPEIQKSPLFKNEANLFDAEKLKEYIANMKDDADAGNSKAWTSWLSTEKSIKQNIERQSYTSLVTAGLGASLKEGYRDYLYSNTKMDAQYVYVPYTSIADSLTTITKGDIRNYVDNHPNKYKPEATRSLKYVKFDILPSQADDADTKKIVEGFINDSEEYSKAAKAKITVAGLKNATDYSTFLNNNKSELDLDSSYKYKSQLPTSIAEAIFNAEIGDVVGAYKDAGAYKISKLVETIKLPDSVNSSHIIISYAGATRSTSTKTKEQAKKTADSVYVLVRKSKSKFTEIANEINSDGTKGKGGDIGWVRKDQAFSPSFDKDFADFIFKNKAGSIKVVETAFGFHVIRIDEQTKYQEAVKLATFGRIIEASEETENNIFEKAETVASKLSEGIKIEDIAKEGNYKVQSALNLKALDENIPGLNNQRSIVNWAYKTDRELGDSKRFEVETYGKRGYAVVVLEGKTEKDGAALNSSIVSKVRPELVNEKKAALISKTLNGSTLEELAKSSNTTVRNASLVSLSSPVLSGVGNEPAVVGAMSTIALDQVSNIINGEKGVFVIKVTKRAAPVELDNYDTFRKKLVGNLKGRGYQMFTVLEETADINDNRGIYY